MDEIDLPAGPGVVNRAKPKTKINPYRALLVVTGICVFAMGLLSFVVPPGVDTDPCWGFMIMHSMEHGGHFNLLFSPNPANIATDRSGFLAWWSPGQYIVPYFFKSILNISTGHAVSLTGALSGLAGLAGFYKFVRKVGFNQKIASLSIAFVGSQLFFVSTFVYYTGGEVLLFAFLGWFLYGCLYFKKAGWPLFLFLFLSALIGFFAKSSFMWMLAAGAIFIWINISDRQVDELKFRPKLYAPRSALNVWLFNCVLVSLPVIVSILFLYIFYLSKGATPASSFGTLRVLPETFLFPLASPFISIFSIDEICDGLIYQPDGPGLSYTAAILILITAALLSFVFIVQVRRHFTAKTYATLFTVFYVVGVLFFFDMYLKQSGISFEARHFRVLGLLAAPGMIYLFFKTKATGAIFVLLWLVSLGLSVKIFLRELGDNRDAAKGNLGISQQLYDRPTMNKIIDLDRTYPHQAVFAVMSSDIAAEIFNNRVITFDTETAPGDDFSGQQFKGNCGRLFVLVPAAYITPGHEPGVLKSFTGYHSFSREQLSQNYYLFTATH